MKSQLESSESAELLRAVAGQLLESVKSPLLKGTWKDPAFPSRLLRRAAELQPDNPQ